MPGMFLFSPRPLSLPPPVPSKKDSFSKGRDVVPYRRLAPGLYDSDIVRELHGTRVRRKMHRPVSPIPLGVARGEFLRGTPPIRRGGRTVEARI